MGNYTNLYLHKAADKKNPAYDASLYETIEEELDNLFEGDWLVKLYAFRDDIKKISLKHPGVIIELTCTPEEGDVYSERYLDGLMESAEMTPAYKALLFDTEKKKKQDPDIAVKILWQTDPWHRRDGRAVAAVCTTDEAALKAARTLLEEDVHEDYFRYGEYLKYCQENGERPGKRDGTKHKAWQKMTKAEYIDKAISTLSEHGQTQYLAEMLDYELDTETIQTNTFLL